MPCSALLCPALFVSSLSSNPRLPQLRALHTFWTNIFAVRMCCPTQCVAMRAIRISWLGEEKWSGDVSHVQALIHLGRYTEASEMALKMSTDKPRLNRNWRAVDYNLNCEFATTTALLLCIYREQLELNGVGESAGVARNSLRSPISRTESYRPSSRALDAGGPDPTGRLRFSLGPRKGYQIVEERRS